MLTNDTQISPTERNILINIMRFSQRRVPQSLISDNNSSTHKKALRTLVEKGLIVKDPNLLDMRQKYVIITTIGEMMIERETEKRFSSTS